ncbi:phage tail assembly protein [Agrobacterium sp. O3.4]|uniref:Phage tail assembly protein n=1 Tax=Agrobacterium cucumeris TaxID=2862866 RepID=A0ABY8RMF6_9HYPH|nr:MULTISPECIES: phage tail assembly protein [Rhizobium/Agrobacterium group]MCZ7468511.1 phage tail assembly protein [Rhizobium rhizogenes]WHO08369.1 phage tail assembly protein [Agrobacterium cucumeris]
MDAISVTLAKPVELEGKTYTELTFREPEVGDLIVADEVTSDIARLVTLLALISEVPLPAFKKIKGSDFKAIVTKTKPLLGNDQKTTTGA